MRRMTTVLLALLCSTAFVAMEPRVDAQAAEVGAIAGAVELEGGAPAIEHGVRVEAYLVRHVTLEPTAWLKATTTVGADGAFQLSGLERGTDYRIKFVTDADGPYADVWWTPETDDRREYSGHFTTAGAVVAGSAESVTMRLPLAARLTGTMTIPRGTRPAQASAGRIGAGEPWTRTEPDADGAYDLGKLIPGDYQATLWADGYQDLYYGAVDGDPGTPGVLRLAGGDAAVFSGRPLRSAGVSGEVLCPTCDPSISARDTAYLLERMDPAGVWVPRDSHSLGSGYPLSYNSGWLYPGTYRFTIEYGNAHGFVSEPFSLGEGEYRNQKVIIGPPSTDRIAGPDRFVTAADIARTVAGYQPVATVFVANGLNFPDALSAGPAAAQLGAPLVLVTPDAIPLATAQALEDLEPERIIVVGGEPSVSVEVARQLAALAPIVERIDGADRFDTSRRLAEHTFPANSTNSVYLAAGGSFPDAVSAGAAAAHRDAPVILVDGAAETLDAETLATIGRLGATSIHVLGSERSINEGIAAAARDAGAEVIRHAGIDRFHTAELVNLDAFGPRSHAYLASGATFPDALAGAALAGRNDLPLLLSRPECVPAGVLDVYRTLEVESVTLLGGYPSLSAAVAALRSC